MGGYARTAWRLMRQWPGPWLLAFSLCGWIVLVARATATSSLGPAMAGMAGHHPGSPHHHGLADWLAMVAAMSPLVLRSEVSWLWRTNLPCNRRAAIALLGAGYTLPWLVLGLVWLALLASRNLDGPALFGAAAMLIVWHASPNRQRLLNTCHRRPGLRAFGPAMAAGTVRFGLRSGLLCTGICGPAMLLAMVLPGYHLVAMVGITVIVTIERYRSPRRPAWRLPWSWIDRAPRWHSLAIVAAPTASSS